MSAWPANACRVWTTAGGGPARTGLFAGSVQLEAKPSRQLATRGAVQAAVVFDEAGHSYATDMAGWVHSWEAGGRPRWQCPLAGAVSATPTLDPAGARLFVGTHAGWVYALATADGRVLWRRQIPTASDPRILADLLFLAGPGWVVLSSWGGQFHALEAASGATARQWDAGLTPGAAASADSDGNLFFLRVHRGQGAALLCLKPGGPETGLHVEPEGPRGAGRIALTAAPVVDEARGRVWFIVNDGRRGALLAWSRTEGRLLGRWPFERTVAAPPALAPDGSVRTPDLAGRLHGLGLETGGGMFRYETGAEYLLAAAACDAEGRSFVGDPLGQVHLVNSTGQGRVIFESPRALQARVSFDPAGHLYVPGTDRRVYVFRNAASV